MSEFEERGGPIGRVDPKRSYDEQPVAIDWHDFLIRRRPQGGYVALGFVFRPTRAEATGVQYRCTTAGVTSGVPFARLRWPTSGTVQDGTAVWTAEAIADTSLKATISANDWPTVAGVTLSSPTASDLVYQTKVAGGANGKDYEIKHRITLSTGELKEGVAILPVRD